MFSIKKSLNRSMWKGLKKVLILEDHVPKTTQLTSKELNLKAHGNWVTSFKAEVQKQLNTFCL